MMKKVKYFIKRLANMNYKKCFDTIKKIYKRTKKSRIIIFFDVIWCGLKYQAGYMDYWLFEMDTLNSKQRKTIVTRGKNNEIVKKYNNQNYIKYLNNKILFNQKFNKYLKRDWMELKDNNINKFKEFINKHKEIIVKPVNLCCGKGIELLTVNNDNYEEIYNNLIDTKRTLVEEVIKERKEIAKLHPESVNTLRLVTLNYKLVVAFIRIGNDNNVVDNFNHGGMAAPINIDTGIIEYPAIDKDGNLYYNHPLTNEKIVGFKIPDMGKIKNFVEKLAKEIPEVRYVGWDVCPTDNDIAIIEGNEFPGHDIYQLPPHRKDGIGLMPIFEKAMKDSINKKLNI